MIRFKYADENIIMKRGVEFVTLFAYKMEPLKSFSTYEFRMNEV